MGILFSNLLLKSIFDFGSWSKGKYTNRRICVFSVWPLPEVKNWFRKQIGKENAYISILFFLKSFDLYFFKKSKNRCSIVFSKSDFTGVGSFFYNFFSEKAEHPKICLSLGGSMPEAQIWKVPDNPWQPLSLLSVLIL